MTLDLRPYSTIMTGLFVEVTTSTGYIRFSDYNTDLTIGGELYQGLGRFVAITTTTSELQSSSGEITITMTGIPDSNLANVFNGDIRGSLVKVYRCFFDPTTGQPLNIPDNPIGRFIGIINNFSLNEEYDIDTRLSSNTILMICSSLVQVLENKVNGRKTNPSSFRFYFPDDASMDRVPSLVNANFDFGIPK